MPLDISKLSESIRRQLTAERARRDLDRIDRHTTAHRRTAA